MASQRLHERESELNRKVYESAILKELGERIGYFLDAQKIIDVITGSLGNLFSYSTVSSMIFSKDKVIFKCNVRESVSKEFIGVVGNQMLQALSALTNKQIKTDDVEEVILGTILDEGGKKQVSSFFNIPLVINEIPVGLINVSSTQPGLYKEAEMTILYKITGQASVAVSKLQTVLETEKGKLNATVASMADGVIMVDKDTQIQVINRAARQMLKIQKKEDVTIFDVIDALTGKVDLRTKLEESIKLDKLVTIDELSLGERTLRVLVSPVKDKEGNIIGGVVLFHDITQENLLAKLRENFTAMIVHELRAPLTAIRGTSDTIIRNDGKMNTAEMRDSLSLIKHSAEVMLSLVNDLLDMAKMEAGRFEINPSQGNINAVVEEAATKFRPLAKEKNLALETGLSSIVRPFLFDRERISQVLNNLLSNAVKYTNSGKVAVSTKLDRNQVIVSVEDTGIGMDKNDLAKIFSRFGRLAGYGLNASQGTGLGLVIAQGIIEAHGGKIWVDSEINKGSTFSFSLPFLQGGDTIVRE